VLNFSEACSVSNRMIMWGFFSYFSLHNSVGYINQFIYVESSLYLWDEAYLIMANISYVFLDFVCRYFIENFCIYVYKRYWFINSFLLLCFCVVLVFGQ